MKMPQALFDDLSAIIATLDTDERRQQYRDRDIVRADAVKDIDVRYRWDLLWLAQSCRRHASLPPFDLRDLSSAHIDTALRRMVKPL